VVTRGLDEVRRDMDDPTTSLVTKHNYCSQDLVNLLLVGRACTNCFDGDKDLDGVSLRGVPRRGRVGLLTLYDWYQNFEVGQRLKDPEEPIWVVCSESHYSVLFSDDAAGALGKRLPLRAWYYDQLAGQDAVIELTLESDAGGGHTGRAGDSVAGRNASAEWGEPPLEFVIETRWPGVRVDWNGTEPIL